MIIFNKIINYLKEIKNNDLVIRLLCLSSKNPDLKLLYFQCANQSKSKLLKLAYTDLMTGCYNRNALEENREMFDRMELYVGIVDIDGLKVINDILGHDRGDVLIKSVANYLKELDAMTIRLGGDEFLVLSVNHVLYPMKAASVGITYKPSDMSLNQAMKKADKDMYYNKNKRKEV